jgi:hypothetical protein
MENNESVIKLKYDTPENINGEEQVVCFRILYWAAFMGRNDIVDHILKLGYSPFAESHDKKNAIFGAVEG